MEDDARGRASGKGLDRPGLEAENRNDRGHRQNQRPEVDARRYWSTERKPEASHRKGLAKDRMKSEPDRQVEDHPDDSSGYPGERAAQRLVVAQPFDKRCAKANP